jgi:hypothetical protein
MNRTIRGLGRGAVSSFAIQNGGLLELVSEVEGLPQSAGFEGIAAY